MTTRQTARPATAGWPVYERSIVGSVLGLPGYAAIGIALGFTGLGVFIDLNRISGLGTIFKGCYFAGCVLAVCWVKRRALFGPMVQPPLLLAIAVPAVVLLSGEGGTGSSGLTDHLLSIGAPLLNGFPTMAVTTAFAVAIGLARYALQRSNGADAIRRPPVRPASGRPDGRRPAGERGARSELRSAAGRPPGARGATARGPGERTADARPERRRPERKPDDRTADRGTADRKPRERNPGDRLPGGRTPTDRKPADRPPSDRADRVAGDRKPG
ncbi:MAG: hypothetical protein QOH45_1745, partial [Pseudonocardiales bacterium]|nr:hypothetical protein [Pseudonocardiales bacterium]